MIIIINYSEKRIKKRYTKNIINPCVYSINMTALFWKTLVIIFLGLAYLGTLIPGLPTTVFLILATWAASKGWPEYYEKLINHPKYGQTLRHWREHGVITRKVKYIAIGTMCISATIMCFTPAPFWVKCTSNGTMFLVAIWLWLRPEETPHDSHNSH